MPPPRKTPERLAPKLDRFKPIVDGWLEEDQKWPRKQRHTARRVWQRLVSEHNADVGESTVRRYVKTVRERQAFALIDVSVPQHHLLGSKAETDFGEAKIVRWRPRSGVTAVWGASSMVMLRGGGFSFGGLVAGVVGVVEVVAQFGEVAGDGGRVGEASPAA